MNPKGFNYLMFNQHMAHVYPEGFNSEQLRAEWKAFQDFLKNDKPKTRLATVREGWRELRMVGRSIF